MINIRVAGIGILIAIVVALAAVMALPGAAPSTAAPSTAAHSTAVPDEIVQCCY